MAQTVSNSQQVLSDHRPTGHIPELDSLRGLAAIAVLICHLPRGFWFGETGVDLFFVLSGYLITNIIIRSVDHPDFLKTFYFRRSIRIFPVYYLTLAIAFALNYFRANPQASEGFPYYLVYLQNIHAYWGSATPPVNMSLGHTWTLAIEEQFYLLWPFLLIFIRNTKFLILCLALIVVSIALRWNGLIVNVLAGRLDGLVLGALLAYLLTLKIQLSRFRSTLVFLSISLLGFGLYLFFWLYHSHGTPEFDGKDYLKLPMPITYISFAYFGLIGAIVVNSGSRYLGFLRSKTLMMIGAISYGLYIYHWVVYEFLDTIFIFRYAFQNTVWIDGLKIILSFAAAVISWFCFEKPILKFKDRMKY